MDYSDLLDQLKRSAPYDWPRLHGYVIAHRIACVAAIRSRLDQLLSDPATTRRGLQTEMTVVLKQMEEHGP